MKKTSYIKFIIIFIVFCLGVFVGYKYNKNNIYSKYCTDETTGVQYIIVVSKDGSIAICPRLNSDGTLYTKNKNKFILIKSDTKGELNE